MLLKLLRVMVKKFYIVSPFDDEQFNKENNKKDFLSFYHKVVKDLSMKNLLNLSIYSH